MNETTYKPARRYPRIHSRHTVMVSRRGPEALEGLTTTEVVGEGGCMFIHEKSLGDGAIVELAITIRERLIETIGRVVYEIPRDDGRYEIGVEFITLGRQDRDALQELFDEPDELD
jgi:hypothetical protein